MNKEFVEPEWDPTYVRMLDAIIEHLANAGGCDDPKINQRDLNIIRALIEFYDFEVVDNQYIVDIMDDVQIRVSQLDKEEKH